MAQRADVTIHIPEIAALQDMASKKGKLSLKAKRSTTENPLTPKKCRQKSGIRSSNADVDNPTITVTAEQPPVSDNKRTYGAPQDPVYEGTDLSTLEGLVSTLRKISKPINWNDIPAWPELNKEENVPPTPPKNKPTSVANESKDKDTWPPLPKPCMACLRRKPINYELLKNPQEEDQMQWDSNIPDLGRKRGHSSIHKDRADLHNMSDNKQNNLSLGDKQQKSTKQTLYKEEKSIHPARLKSSEHHIEKPGTSVSSISVSQRPLKPSQEVSKVSSKKTSTPRSQETQTREMGKSKLCKEQSRSSSSNALTNFFKPKVEPAGVQLMQNKMCTQSDANMMRGGAKPSQGEDGVHGQDGRGTGTDVNKGSDEPLRSCPLCQTVFTDSMDQMSIDGHIALCLSNTGDDVVW